MKIYLAGKMRGLPDFGFPAFHEAAAHLRALGHSVLSPAEHDEENGFDPTKNSLEGFDLYDAMRWDIAAVLAATAVVVLPGWQSSSGVAIELAVANAIGTSVFEYHRGMPLRPLRPESICAEADRIVSGERQAAYGHPAIDFARTGRIWGAILGVPDVDPRLVGLCMLGVKMSREVNAPKRDNRVDMAGYAKTLDLVATYEERRGS